MRPLSKLHKVVLGACVASGAATYYYLNQPDAKVYASRIVGYESPPHAKWNENWDYRAPKQLLLKRSKNEKDENFINNEIESLKPKTMRHLILIRHGQYNLDGQRDEERMLTKLGRLQADFTGKRLKELGLPYTTMVKSTMCRAQETGKIISDSLPDTPVTHCDMLREGAPIPPEPPSYTQQMHKFFVDGARIEAAFRKYFHRASPKDNQDEYLVLVCHANVIRYFVCRALQLPPEAWLRMSLNHGSITWITIKPNGRVILKCLGDSGHIPPQYITSR